MTSLGDGGLGGLGLMLSIQGGGVPKNRWISCWNSVNGRGGPGKIRKALSFREGERRQPNGFGDGGQGKLGGWLPEGECEKPMQLG